MSCPTTTLGRPVTATKALPTRRARSSSIWSGTVPRTSYALKTAARLSGSVVGMRRPYRTAESELEPAQSSEGSARRWPRRVPSAAPAGAAGPRPAAAGRPRARRRRGRAGRRRTDPDGRRRGRAGAPPSRGARRAARCAVAQVVGVRLGVGRERADDRGLVGVHVGERGRGRTSARGARTATKETHGRDATTQPGPAHRRLAVVKTWRMGRPRDRRGRGMRGPAFGAGRTGRSGARPPHRTGAVRPGRHRRDERRGVALDRGARPGRAGRGGHPGAAAHLGRAPGAAGLAGAGDAGRRRRGWCCSAGPSSIAPRAAPTSRRWC